MRRFSRSDVAKAAVLGLGLAAVLGTALPARADDDDRWEHHHRHHERHYGPYVYYGYGPGYYVAPPPVVYAPPPPVVYAPPPVAYAPAPFAGLNIVVPIKLH